MVLLAVGDGSHTSELRVLMSLLGDVGERSVVLRLTFKTVSAANENER